MVVKLQDDIKEEKEKLVDFKTAIENITPGKKAEELRKHLAALIVEGEQKIKRLEEKFAEANARILAVEQENKAEIQENKGEN